MKKITATIIKQKYLYFSSFIHYYKTVWWILKTRGISAAWKFVYVKLFISEGEGGWGVISTYVTKPFLATIGKMQWLCRYPTSIEIEITHRCNKKCLFCEHTSPNWKEPNQDTTYNQFLDIVENFPKLKWVNLPGEGDSFLNKDYMRMIYYLKERDIPVFLVDSFDLITPEIGQRLVDMRVDGIYISFDAATKETYEKIKVGCKFERTIENIKALIKYKKERNSMVPEIIFRYIITNLNVNEMPQYPGFIASLVDDISDLGPRPSIEFAGLLKFPGVEQYMVPEVPKEIEEATIRAGNELGINITFSHPGEERIPRNRCTAWTEPYIMMGGYVLSCCALLQTCNRDRLRKLSYGNIHHTPFQEIWDSPRYRECRESLQSGGNPELCKGCRIFDVAEEE